jgi:type I restriction-modification system DNA methylase subunit
MKNIFDWLKAINNTKPPVESFTSKDWEVWNSYMIHRFISMNPDYIEIVNYVQDLPPQEKRMIYNVYKEFIPKNNKWNKYIKSKTKEPNKELIEHLRDYLKCSSKEAKEAITLLDNTKISRILSNRGLETKEIKKILK